MKKATDLTGTVIVNNWWLDTKDVRLKFHFLEIL